MAKGACAALNGIEMDTFYSQEGGRSSTVG